MALTRSELESVTRDHFITDGGKAFDQYFLSNWLIYRAMRKPKYRPAGGVQIKVPLTYDRLTGGSFDGVDQFDVARKDIINSALFQWRHNYVNVTIVWTEELENAGPEEEVDMVVTKLENAQASIRDDLADSLYSDGTGNLGKDVDGLDALFNTTTSTAYGSIAQDDMAKWSAGVTTTSEPFTSAVVRTMRTAAKVGDAVGDKPSLIVTTDALLDSWLNQLQTQQRFVSQRAAKAGFDGVFMLDQAEIFSDGKCPDGTCYALNDRHWGYAVHRNGLFVRTAWKVPTNQAVKSMQILWKGNMICTRRNSHHKHTGLT